MTDYKLMPVEPIPEMLNSAMAVCTGFSGDYGTHNDHLSEDAAREVYRAFRSSAPAVQGEPVALDDYDPGLINDYGGGDVGWWQDYIRSEIERANEHWRAQMEQRPAVPEGFRIFRSPHEGDTDIHLAMKLGDEGYLMSSWLSEGGRDDDDTVGRLAYRLADALLSAQPTKQRPAAPAVQGEPVAMVDADDDGMWADILPNVTVKVGQILYAAAQPTEQQAAPDVGTHILSLISDECRYWQGRDEARRGGYAILYAKAKELISNQQPAQDVAARRQSPPDDPLGGLTYQPDGDANCYTLSRARGDWVARIQFNGELYGPEQERILEAMLGDRNVRYGDGYHDGLADAWRDQPDVAGLVGALEAVVNCDQSTEDAGGSLMIYYADMMKKVRAALAAGDHDACHRLFGTVTGVEGRDGVILCELKEDNQDAEQQPDVAQLVEALDLALEYWRDRQQGYKKPKWVIAAESALAAHRKPPAAKMVPVPYELLCRLADEDWRTQVPDEWIPEMIGPDGSKGPATFTVGDLRAAADLVRAFEGGEA